MLRIRVLSITDSLLIGGEEVNLRARRGAVLHVGERTEAHNMATGAHLETGVGGRIVGSDAAVRLLQNGDTVIEVGSSDLEVAPGSTDMVISAGRRRY